MRFVALCCFLAIFFAVIGCGGNPTGTISGKVYYKGEILKGGNVTFESESVKATKSSEIDEQGNYKIEKLPVGDAVITVSTESMKPPSAAQAMAGKNKPPPGATPPPQYKQVDPEERAKRYTPIPEKYSNPKMSGLKCAVKSGNQPYDIKLEEK